MSLHAREIDASELAAFVAHHFPERGIHPDVLIARSWYRSITEHRLDPHGRCERHILDAEEIRRHRARHREYLAIAGQGVAGLARHVLPAGFAVLLSDEDGVVLDARMPTERTLFTRSGLVVGARWDEALAGTNGIGTALAAASSLTIHRTEHFLAANARLSCSVAPLFDEQGRLRGCLNATSLSSDGPKEAQHLTLQLVKLYARLIENAHFRQRYRDSLTLAIRPADGLTDPASERLLALDEAGRVIGANHATFAACEERREPSPLGRRIDSLLPAGLDELLALSDGGARSARLRTPHEAAPLEIGLRLPAARPRPAQTTTQPRTPPGAHPDLDRLGGSDARLRQGIRRLRKVLDKGIPILITGETGTGKEAFARAIHRASARRDGPFVALNCAAIPETLIESELFGYAAGSFTGASRKGMKGKLELANGGTLFLDEIGDMPAHLQTRLLRVLAEGEIFPLGAAAPLPLDVQVVSATHQDLAAMIRDKRFREDLFYRLSGMTLALPALRERDDRAELIETLLAAQPGGAGLRLDDPARRLLLDHPWPGNIRQLLNCLRHAVALAENDLIDSDCLPAELRRADRAEQPAVAERSPGRAEPAGDDEAGRLRALLRRSQWNISAAAEACGVARSTLYRRMKKHGIVQPNRLF